MACDLAERMEISAVAEWIHLAIVDCAAIASPCEMVDHDVDHQIHVSGMHRGRQCLQVANASEMGVQCVDILLPVAVIGFSSGGLFIL